MEKSQKFFFFSKENRFQTLQRKTISRWFLFVNLLASHEFISFCVQTFSSTKGPGFGQWLHVYSRKIKITQICVKFGTDCSKPGIHKVIVPTVVCQILNLFTQICVKKYPDLTAGTVSKSVSIFYTDLCYVDLAC